jgi:hypothetical protein
MFRVVLPPIVRSAYTCIYSIWYLSHRYCYLPLSWKSWNQFERAVGGVRHPQHAQIGSKQFPDINKLCNFASCWIYIGIPLGTHPILRISRTRVNYIKVKRLAWAGHLMRMNNDRTQNKIFNTKPVGVRRVGRSKLR